MTEDSKRGNWVSWMLLTGIVGWYFYIMIDMFLAVIN